MSAEFDSAEFEVAVVGGGIHGAGIAQAAAAAGYRVALFERKRWAAGTSSKSSKLIHGGLRYLETGQISLVYHSLRERRLLLKNAERLVKPVAFHIPVYRETSRRPWQIAAGLSLYRVLAGNTPLAHFHCVPRSRWAELDGLKTDGLQRVFQYGDAQTDDRVLTEAVVHSAEKLGASTYCPADLLHAERSHAGYRLTLQTPSGQLNCHTRVLINAAGPWVNTVAERIHPTVPQQAVDLVRGSHIVLPGAPAHGIYYLESPRDHRAVFAMPWHGQTLVGTTEAIHRDGPNKVSPTEAEQEYLQETFRHYFPARSTQIQQAFAGLRVLPSDSSSPFARSRETILLCDDGAAPAMIAVYGGKLTGYRHTAEQVAALLRKTLGKREPCADTRQLRL